MYNLQGKGGRIGRRRVLAGLSALAATACSRAAPDLEPGEQGRIARISDGDLLALDTGLRVRLAEIEAPSPYGEGEPFGAEASAMLEREAIGRPAQLFYGGLSRDRYDRAIAHVFAEDETGGRVWLNGLMVRQGGARVRTYPDNATKVRDLYAFEEEAREAGRGLWALDAYRVRRPGDWPAPDEERAFIVAEGPLLAVEPSERYGAGILKPGGVALGVPASMGPAPAPVTLQEGRMVRIRGRSRVQDTGAVSLDLSHWAQVETL